LLYSLIVVCVSASRHVEIGMFSQILQILLCQLLTYILIYTYNI
jgi:hypothetical protein